MTLSSPILKSDFEQWVKEVRSKVADGKTYQFRINLIEKDGCITPQGADYTEDDITDEKVEEYKRTLEEAHPYPIRIIPILNIIKEEAEPYFNGSKTAEEVGYVVTNRVQLYLDEGH